MLQQCLRNELELRNLPSEVVAIVSQVVVSEDDEAFESPTKPIGPFYSEEKAVELEQAKGWAMRNDADRGFRRVVPSPKPLEIVETAVIKNLLDTGAVVIAVGGGGIPVVRTKDGLRGIEAVIDKDLAAAELARETGAERLIILTGVEEVYVDFGKPQQKPLGEVRLSEIKELDEAGEFPPGSMGPKIEAAIAFLESGGKKVIISHARKLREACDGKAGTHILPD